MLRRRYWQSALKERQAGVWRCEQAWNYPLLGGQVALSLPTNPFRLGVGREKTVLSEAEGNLPTLHLCVRHISR